MLLSQYSAYNFIWFDPLGSLTLQWVDNGETDTVPRYRPPKVISTHFCQLVTDSATTFPQSTFEAHLRERLDEQILFYRDLLKKFQF